VQDKFVIGMVGRLTRQKNYPFALSCFRELAAKDPKAQLLIAGNGEDEQKICDLVQENGLDGRVSMLGRREDIHALYQVFDVLIMPSLYEGFPVAAVEAMATGLPVLLADTITKELSFGSAVQYLPLQEKVWVNALQNGAFSDEREKRQREINENGLDLRDTAVLLERLYEKGDIHATC